MTKSKWGWPLQLCFDEQVPNMTFKFWPLGPWGPRVRPMTPMHSTRIYPWPKWARVPFMKKVQIQKFRAPSQLAQAFWPNFLRLWADIKNSAPNIFLPCCLDSEKVWHDPLAPKPWEAIHFVETPFFGGLGVWFTLPKITCEECGRPWKFRANPLPGSKVTPLFLCDRRTDGRTHRHFRMTPLP